MATRRRIGVSIASTEAARRQLIQPVPCWEKVWTTPSFGSSLKVYKWVKTEKVQQFDDDEGDVDEPLAPLPDEPEVVEVDEDEAEETRIEPTQIIKDIDMETQDDRPSEVPPSPKPALTLTQDNSELDVTDPIDSLDPGPTLTLEPVLGDGTEDILDDEVKVDAVTEGLELDISGLGPDGLQLEGAHDLSQLGGQDDLMGGPLMDQTVDPFAEPT
ncbi:hypothetical protein CPB83DRAFT_855575 [Crepidotus variabilis]|uniref:Uncharacterized protein n=1 Tax=Crepidotus variabilis TaxID=179855 RepID=A0A9P6EE20_9AGAR|nr:hypothetical protein CPB83DRAFT_855575 [Crepidotus variabilis]